MSGDGGLRQEVTCIVHDLSDRSEVVFDDERVVVNAGLERFFRLEAGALGLLRGSVAMRFRGLLTFAWVG